jgi:hypothetical protein
MEQKTKVITQEKDRIECAIRHIQTAADVDPWAMEIAVGAMRKQIPKKPIEKPNKYIEYLLYLYCPSCENWIGMWNKRVKYGDMYNIPNRHICPYCGQAIEFGGD